ncbi:hypothetical protein TH60_21390 [Pantoea ananatis]|uniref:Uncharacterized protein n=3 Tax=Pantoea ananas TaxID=553 RepID=A0A8A4KCP9_PANAN|nr:hypothetical protein [Pantoea ananatis]MDC7872049.1 hypothetical protein [Pantoea ananatis]QTC48389.1 hypothetical protein H0Z12_22595 [Pantoea ananatis]
MPIPRKRFPIALSQTTPTQLTVQALKKQLTDIGLTCPDSHESKLQAYIDDVRSQLPQGAIQTYAILQPATQSLLASVPRVNGLAGDFVVSAKGDWTPDGTGMGYGPELEYIQYSTHFDWLKANRPGFTGVIDAPPAYTGKYDSIDAIKNLFVEVGATASATLIKGLNKDSVEAVLSNAIAPLDDTTAKDYDQTDSRVIFLVDNYNPQTSEADGIGVLSVEWHLVIKDYTEKKKDPKHQTTLTITARSVLYSSLEDMNADYLAAQSHFKQSSFLQSGIPIKNSVDIFAQLPPANRDTFNRSLPRTATTNQLEAIVLFAPNLQNIGVIDNTHSSATTTYEKSLTTGFTFTSSQTFSAEASFEASAEVVKAGVKIGFSISFTEEWSKSTTDTFSFSVGPNKKAFTYQGYLQARILRYNPADDSFAYVNSVARFVTNILTTSEVPLVDNA